MRYLFLLLPLLLLTGCVPSRGEADSKLAVACEAGIKAAFADPKENIAVQKASYSFKNSYDGLRLRIVTLDAHYTYGTSEPDKKTYTCAYSEEWNLFSYTPEFYNMQGDNIQFGNYNGEILGDITVMAKITDAQQKILH